jgi:DNA-directed RNA polymerases I, II, and III subunit RPABC4
MSKEAYTPPPKEAYSPPTAGASGFGSAPRVITSPISYLCAGNFPSKSLVLMGFVDCGASNTIGVKEQIRCRECGHRVMYKKRTSRMGTSTALGGSANGSAI